MRVAMLTYSVKPRGGVEHALAIAEALAAREHDVCVSALAAPEETFFRPTPIATHLVAHVPTQPAFDERIFAMVAAYREGLRPLLADGGFDIVHAQDCISANAALDLRDEGLIEHVVRTVHHVDEFISPSLIACQDRSIRSPDLVLCVSEPWIQRLADEFGVWPRLVRNGVDGERFRTSRDHAERELDREALGLGDRFTVLTVGGIEPRKGSLTLLEGFAHLRDQAPELDPLLLIVGGATLFDYRDEIDRFATRARQLGVGEHVRHAGTVTPAELERHYRAADVFAFPSTKEGFGLAALEALAAGLPVVASQLDVFLTFLTHGENALLCPAGDAEALGECLARVAAEPALRERLVRGGRAVVDAYAWDTAAAAHEDAYRSFANGRIGARL